MQAGSLECGSLFGQIARSCDHRQGLYEDSLLKVHNQSKVRGLASYSTVQDVEDTNENRHPDQNDE
jgi:hypothetical protein